jgi:isochorismate synthase
MNDNKNMAQFIDKLIAKNSTFALWSMPGNDTPEILIAGNQEIIYPTQLSTLNGRQGFIFSPYTISEQAPMILLKPGTYKKGIPDILDIDCAPYEEKENAGEDEYNFPFIISKGEFIKDVVDTIAHIRSSKLAKVILSRIIPFQRQNESTGALYLQLLQQTPNAFVYLVNLPFTGQGFRQAGLWMGATPELLLRSQGKTLETLSLAGTQTRLAVNDYSWHTKEIEEQAFVSRYLLDVFYRFNIHPYITRGPETLESGKVAHLSTIFRFSAKKLATNLGDFIAELHPTPAVCGYPKSKAAKFILKMEKHDRRYYTGYLGPWRLNGEVGLFVNLRCMEIKPQLYILYSGVGITARSVPEDEWEETNKKATTLLSAIEAVQNR